MPSVLSFPTSIAVQQLLSLPTVQRASIGCRFIEPSLFLRMWDRCSPNITHLEVHCLQHGVEVFPPIPQCLALLRLQSLRIGFLGGVAYWFTHPWCPLDFSGLKAISISDNTDIIRWQKIQPALQTIEVLDFLAYVCPPPPVRREPRDLTHIHPKHVKPTIDLSSLPNLALLRINIFPDQAGPLISGTLATIAPTNCIRKIIISPTFSTRDRTHWQQLDRILVSLPAGHIPVVEFQMRAKKYDRLVAFLPHMSAKNMVGALFIFMSHDLSPPR